MAKVRIHLEGLVIFSKMISVFPKPTPLLDIAPAADPNAVSKSKPVANSPQNNQNEQYKKYGHKSPNTLNNFIG